MLEGTQLLVLQGEPSFPFEQSGLDAFVDRVPEKIWFLELQDVVGLILPFPLLVVVIVQLWHRVLPGDVRGSDGAQRGTALQR